MKRLAVGILILVVVIVGLTSYTYACVNGGTKPDSCSDMAFVSVSVADNEVTSDTANIQARITCEGRTIEACIRNAYPQYEGYMKFTIKNKGSIPIRVDTVSITEYEKRALEVTLTDLNPPVLIEPGCTIGSSLTVQILDGASQSRLYTFKVIINGSSQPMEHPRSVGYWKQEFSNALLGRSSEKPQLSPTQLEDYLDQISGQSQVFSFTGTQKQKFSKALTTLEPMSSSMEAKLKAQLFALWLNYVAGWTSNYRTEGVTTRQTIEGSEDALIHHRTSQYEYWKNLCERFNNI